MLLVIYTLGTGGGIRSVAAGEHLYSEEDLCYSRRRFLGRRVGAAPLGEAEGQQQTGGQGRQRQRQPSSMVVRPARSTAVRLLPTTWPLVSTSVTFAVGPSLPRGAGRPRQAGRLSRPMPRGPPLPPPGPTPWSQRPSPTPWQPGAGLCGGRLARVSFRRSSCKLGHAVECGKPTQGLPSGGYPFLDANELSARRGTLAVSTDAGDDTPLRLRVRLTSRLR